MLNFDLSSIERRLLEQQQQSNKNYSAAVKLPRRHPLRFALLYGMGPQKLLDYVKSIAQPCPTGRSITLESEIQMFENWQHAEENVELFQRTFPNAPTRAARKSRLLAMQYGFGALKS